MKFGKRDFEKFNSRGCFCFHSYLTLRIYLDVKICQFFGINAYGCDFLPSVAWNIKSRVGKIERRFVGSLNVLRNQSLGTKLAETLSNYLEKSHFGTEICIKHWKIWRQVFFNIGIIDSKWPPQNGGRLVLFTQIAIWNRSGELFQGVF